MSPTLSIPISRVNAAPGAATARPHAAKIDDYIEEHLNGRRPDEPPPEYPMSSQLDGELRELRVRFADTRYRILYQRSDRAEAPR